MPSGSATGSSPGVVAHGARFHLAEVRVGRAGVRRVFPVLGRHRELLPTTRRVDPHHPRAVVAVVGVELTLTKVVAFCVNGEDRPVGMNRWMDCSDYSDG
jgi:hypothetical protein